MFYKMLNNTTFYSDFNERLFAIGGGQSLGKFKPIFALDNTNNILIKAMNNGYNIYN